MAVRRMLWSPTWEGQVPMVPRMTPQLQDRPPWRGAQRPQPMRRQPEPLACGAQARLCHARWCCLCRLLLAHAAGLVCRGPWSVPRHTSHC